MSENVIRLTPARLLLVAIGCLVIGVIGGMIGGAVGDDSSTSSGSPVPTEQDELKGSVRTTLPTVATTLKPGSIITVAKTIVPQAGTPGPAGPQGPVGPAGPAGKDGLGFKSIRWIEVGGHFEFLGEWTASCPSGTLAITWQARGLSDSVISYAGQSIYSNNPNDWMFRASDESPTLDFDGSDAHFALGCVAIG